MYYSSHTIDRETIQTIMALLLLLIFSTTLQSNLFLRFPNNFISNSYDPENEKEKDEYDQWLDCESADIYPVGWCVLVNHKLEGPPRVAQQQPPKPAPKAKIQRKRKPKKGAVGGKTPNDNNTQSGKFNFDPLEGGIDPTIGT